MKLNKMASAKIILLLTFLSVNLLAQSGKLLFEAGNKAYADGKYEDALGYYKKCLATGEESGEVYFNMGNAYFKLNQVAEAILFYERSARYLQNDEALQQNLKIARLKIVDKIEPVPELFLSEWWQSAIHLMSLNSFAWINFILFVIMIILAALYVIFRLRIIRSMAVIFAVLFFLTTVLFAGRIYEFETEKFAIILAEKVSVVSEPGISATEVFILHSGTKVKINRTLDSWVEITLADGKTGWCYSNILEVI